MKKIICLVVISSLFIFGNIGLAKSNQATYRDVPFWQDYAEKYALAKDVAKTKLFQVRSDRNGVIQILSENGLLKPYKDRLVRDVMHRPFLDMHITGLDTYQSQFLYLTDKAVLSNAWAGKFYVAVDVSGSELFAMGNEFNFLVAGKTELAYFQNGNKSWHNKNLKDRFKQILFDPSQARFLLLSKNGIFSINPASKKLRKEFNGSNLTCMELTKKNFELVVGTNDGYLKLDSRNFQPISALQKKLPWTDITCIREIGDKIWFGTSWGAFALKSDGGIDYYASQRWLIDDRVIDIAPGPENSVLVLTKSGLSQIHFKLMTLAQKAEHFDKLTRLRHVRYGLNSAFVMSKPGDFSTGTLVDQDNDGLWTAMYLAGELFRYAVTKFEQALQNSYEAFEAMERLDYINPLEGFPSRAFERTGYKMSDRERWQPVGDGVWDWKATTSSDEIVGHFFAYCIFAEIVPDAEWRQRAITQMDRIMDHIVRNNWYLIDYNGKPTHWGRWHPEYVNRFPKQVGDRRLNSIEIIGFLQTAYHFTKKEIYKTKAYELMEKHGYLDNIMIPITEIGFVEGIDLSDGWNHSDDELAFLSYWNLYRYAFTDELREKYAETIKGHWEIERPEKNPLWNFIYAMTEAKEFDLEEAIWSLKEFPLDMVGWTIKNSHRKDLEFLEPNFRAQSTRYVLPPDERRMSKYNGNAFTLDGGENGHREYSGDIYLLPYWMGRYIGVIK